MDRHEKFKIVTTKYTNGAMHRSWTFNPTTCSFTHTSYHVTIIGEIELHENSPTYEDVQEYTLLYNGKCRHCGNDLEDGKCLRGQCYWYGMKYVPELACYYKKKSVDWDAEKICYCLKESNPACTRKST